MQHHFKEIEANAACAWSPQSCSRIMVAAGSLSGVMDASFSSDSKLEIYAIDMQSSSSTVLSSVEAPSRYKTPVKY